MECAGDVSTSIRVQFPSQVLALNSAPFLFPSSYQRVNTSKKERYAPTGHQFLSSLGQDVWFRFVEAVVEEEGCVWLASSSLEEKTKKDELRRTTTRKHNSNIQYCDFTCFSAAYSSTTFGVEEKYLWDPKLPPELKLH